MHAGVALLQLFCRPPARPSARAQSPPARPGAPPPMPGERWPGDSSPPPGWRRTRRSRRRWWRWRWVRALASLSLSLAVTAAIIRRPFGEGGEKKGGEEEEARQQHLHHHLPLLLAAGHHDRQRLLPPSGEGHRSTAATTSLPPAAMVPSLPPPIRDDVAPFLLRYCPSPFKGRKLMLLGGDLPQKNGGGTWGYSVVLSIRVDKRRRFPLLLSPCPYSIHPLANARLWGKEGIRRKEGEGEGGNRTPLVSFVRR